MHLNLERDLQRFQRVDVGFSRHQATVFLTTLLVVGLAGIAPSVALLVKWLELPVPRPLLLAVAVIGGLYVTLIVVMGRVVLGTCISFIVTSTFVANIPLTPAGPMYPGNLGPQLILFELPMLVLLVIYALNGEYSLDSFTRVEYAFGAFVLWSVLSAFFGYTPRVVTALFFSVYMFIVWLGFGVTLRSVRRGTIELRGVLTVFLIAVYGHVAFSVVQFINQAPFKLTVLGEVARSYSPSIINLGILGKYHFGVFLSGFTGGNSPLSILIILAVPVALALYKEMEMKWRILGYLSVLVMVGILRLTAKDAARGALLIAMVFFALFWLWEARKDIAGPDVIRTFVRRWKTYGVLLIASVMMTLYPSTTTGGTVEVPNGNEGGSNTGGPPPSNGGGTLPADPATISVPYFNLESLGIRFQQYVAGIILFLEHPLFGVGGANYPFVAEQYGLPAKLRGEWFPLHNMYIATLAETGLPGFVFFMAAFALVFWHGYQLLKRSADTLLAAGLIAGMLGYAAVMFWEVTVRYVMVVPFWMLMGALVADTERL